MSTITTVAAVAVLIAFNIPVLVLIGTLPLTANLKQALKEKNPIGGASDTTSYSRVTGLVGAAVLTAFFWAIGNVVLLKAFTAVADIKPIIDGSGRLFMVGAALFLPYAFNQIKSAFGAAGAAAATVASAPVSAPAPTPAPGAPQLTLSVVNLSTAIDDAAFAAAVAAVGVQIGRDFQAEWGMGAQLNPSRLTLNSGAANVDGAGDAVIYVGDTSTDPTTGASGAFGYHSENYGQLPYAFIYLDVCRQYGEAWSATLSHEVLELLADPTTVLTATGPAPAGVGAPGQTVVYDLEVCDPTQGDTYTINNVAVSNFVTRAYFGMVGGASTSTNFLKLALDPFGARPGGYFQYEDSAGAHQVNGSRVDAQRLAARALLAGYRRNARRGAGTRRRA